MNKMSEVFLNTRKDIPVLIVLCLLTSSLSEASYDICPSTCECLGAIVDCSSNGLNQVPEDLPSWVERLNLNKNPRLDFYNDSLADLPYLEELDITHLHLDQIPNLGEIPSLKHIDLTGNRISDASSAWSENAPHVHTLIFIKNHFQHLNFTQLDPLPLRKVDFKSNSISTISSDFSVSLSTLTDLRLARNKIDDRTFQNLSVLFNHMTNLMQLDLNRNLLEKPQALMFQNLTKLTVLKMKRNKIIDLPPGIFFGLKALTTLRLENNTNITEINNGWLFDQQSLKVLGLSHNNIGQIKDNSWEVTKKLAVLDLNYNRLGCRHSEPNFNGLKNLRELYLSHNCFTTIDATTFGELLKLEKLDLSYNQLQLSIEYSTGAFSGLKSLVSLNLAYNNIETIHGDVFHSLTLLTSLDLSGNSVKTLPQNPFRNLNKLKHLSFNSSRLVCDCSLDWMPEFLKSRHFSAMKFTCGFPEELKGRSIIKLKKRHLSCNHSVQTFISKFPHNQTVLFGNNMTLECVAKVGGDRPSFTWTKNRKVVEPFYVKTFMNVEADDSTKIVSQFYIDNVTHSHAGTYQCIARNTYGPSYSPPARVVVHRFPYFTETPSSVEVKQGDVVGIKCTAAGYPAPEILVNKEGDFPAPRENRLHYNNNVYYIKPVFPRDDGVYICTARNEAGAINVTARISVIHTPTFSRPAQNQTATMGQSIALECQGTGQPKPKVTWYKDAQLVIPDRNHVLVEDGQFFLLLKVNKEDIGTYECRLTNRLGTQRREINLTYKRDVILPAITGLIVMIVVICIVLTSFIWVIIIYHMSKKNRNKGSGASRDKPPYAGNKQQPAGIDQLMPSPTLHKGPNNGLLAPSHHPFTPIGQDSGSEHSSGKDSGVGESHQRSTEDLHREPPRQRKSLLVYPDSPSGPSLKGTSGLSRAAMDDVRPRCLSTFNNQQQFEMPRSYNPTYASLRRGSTSRLLAVPSPVTPGDGLGMNSLPRHAYRNHSKYSIPAQDTASLSRRKPSLSRSIGGSRSVTEPQRKEEELRRPTVPPSLSKEAVKIVPNFYSFKSSENHGKDSRIVPNGIHLLPSR